MVACAAGAAAAAWGRSEAGAAGGEAAGAAAPFLVTTTLEAATRLARSSEAMVNSSALARKVASTALPSLAAVAMSRPTRRRAAHSAALWSAGAADSSSRASS